MLFNTSLDLWSSDILDAGMSVHHYRFEILDVTVYISEQLIHMQTTHLHLLSFKMTNI